MEIPRFPQPPTRISRSLPIESTMYHNQNRNSFNIKKRPRSASWLVVRRHIRRNQQQQQQTSYRNNHVRPFAVEAAVVASRGLNRRVEAELMVTMTESKYECRDGLQRIREDSPTRPAKEEHHVDEAEVICRAEANHEPPRIVTRLPPINNSIPERLQEVPNLGAISLTPPTLKRRILKSTAAQTQDTVLYRLRVFPTLKDIVDEENKPPDPKRASRLFRYFRFLGRVAFCQFGLAWLLTLWAVLGAGAFYVTEGPRERQQVVELKNMQRDLAVGLATELRQLRADDQEMEPLWSNKVRQYVARHEKLLLIAVSSGYGEGGDNGQLWTFSGCMLFAIAVLTTLGFGAPVPRTNAGRTVAVIFAAIGIPAHFLLILNLGLLFAVRLKRYGIRRKYPNECRDLETIDSMPMPMWVKIIPFFILGVYYIIGIVGFGVIRLKPFSESLLFPLEFTAAGGLSTIAGYVRILYGLYLEGAVTLCAIAVAVLKVAATQSLTNIGLKYGLLIPV